LTCSVLGIASRRASLVKITDTDRFALCCIQVADQYGLAFLWTVLLALPLMAAVQELCDRTALATGTGLGELAVQHFRRADGQPR
jgi:hypothetical protein